METTDNNRNSELAALERKLDELSAQVAWLVARQRAQAELLEEATPILREMMGVASTKLGDLEEKGYFAFGRELLNVADRIVTSYSADDVRQLGDNIVTIMDTVRSVTQPEVLEVASRATTAITETGRAEPMGVMGMLKASHDDDVRRGMAVALEVLRHIGRGANRANGTANGTERTALPKPAPLARMLAPSRTRVEGAVAGATAPAIAGSARRTAAVGGAPKAAAGAPKAATGAPKAAAGAPNGVRVDSAQKAAPIKVPAKVTAASCGIDKQAAPVAATTVDGVAFTADGFLVDPGQWNRDLGAAIARNLGILELTDEHWKVLEWARSDYQANGVSPNIRRITTGSGVATKDLYRLFPKAPGIATAKIAGIPKPVGCI